jgi:hypothetical protein
LFVEQPVLWLGMAGFSLEQQARLNAMLAVQPSGWPVWRMSKFAEADAWWVDGSKIRLMRDGTLKISAGHPGESAVQLNLDEVDRPIAFTAPLASTQFEPMYTFNPAAESSVRGVLQQFEGWLRPLRAQFALGAQVIERENSLKPGIYHVSHKGVLLAVMDLHEWQVGISPTVRPVDIEQAHWDKRPPAANDIPERFVRSSLTQLMWAYAQRTSRDVLPRRYRTGPIYFRRSPRVPLRWLKDSQLLLLRELSMAPGSFDVLRQRTGLTDAQLARDLASLYFAGSITSTRSHASTGGSTAREERPAGWPAAAPSPIGPDSRFAGRPASVFPADLTAPVPLQYE